MSLLVEPIGPLHYVFVSAFLFVCGLMCMMVKRNALGILMGAELLTNAANLNFVAFSNPLFHADGQCAFGLDGQFVALFAIVLAEAEVAIALAIAIAYYNTHATVDVDRADELKG